MEHRVARLLLEETAGHLVNNRLEAFEKGFKQIMGDTFSYFDAGGEPEKTYQAYVLGLLVPSSATTTLSAPTGKAAKVGMTLC
ncbi:MAG: hypothetical protein H6573_15375 [Lewinellaceae bacterium]|nr:hypothetical protein [Lewinellaceae bacterium]